MNYDLMFGAITGIIMFNAFIIMAQYASLIGNEYYLPKYPIIQLYFKEDWLSFYIWIINIIFITTLIFSIA